VRTHLTPLVWHGYATDINIYLSVWAMLLESDKCYIVMPCYVWQDCELHYMSDKPCGLQKTEYWSWREFSSDVSSLPDCRTGYEPGRDQ